MSDDEYDNIPDDFASVEGIDWDQLLAAPSLVPPSNFDILEPTPSQPESTEPLEVEEMDDVFLAELDVVEQRVIQEMRARPSRLQTHGSGPVSSDDVLCATDSLSRQAFTNQGTVVPAKRPHQSPSPKQCYSSPNKKGKTKENPNVVLQKVLASFEDELTCPICCDIFVASHVANPCGHNLCGDCGWQWIIKKKNKGCPICRTSLSKSQPLIPNIVMDNMVEKHVKAVAIGDEDWQIGGKRYIEWSARKEQWKDSAEERARYTSKKRKYQANIIDLSVFEFQQPLLVQDDEGDGDFELDEIDDGGQDLIPAAPRRLTRRTRTLVQA